jgi:hypothetical protein
MIGQLCLAESWQPMHLTSTHHLTTQHQHLRHQQFGNHVKGSGSISGDCACVQAVGLTITACTSGTAAAA